MVQKGKTTTIYIDPELRNNHERVVQNKLNLRWGPRIVQLVQKDLAELSGQQDLAGEAVNYEELQDQHRALVRRKSELMKLLEKNSQFDKLKQLADDAGLKSDFSNSSKVIVLLLGNDKLGDESKQLFIQLLEANQARKQIEKQMFEAQTKKYLEAK